MAHNVHLNRYTKQSGGMAHNVHLNRFTSVTSTITFELSAPQPASKFLLASPHRTSPHPSLHSLSDQKVPFDIFDRKYKDSWYTVMQHFRQQVEEIEDMTKSFIEQSFQKLRSAEGAFELVQNFQNIQSRESINQSIDERYKDILSQYTKELDHIGAIFHAHKALPPIYKNYPPVAGAIAWARDLYNRAKRPILRFKVRTANY